MILGLIVAAAVAAYLVPRTTGTMVLGGHEVRVTPTYGGDAVLRIAPGLPTVGFATGGPLGARLVVGRSTTHSTLDTVAQYAALAANPQGAEDRVRSELRSLVIRAILEGVLAGVAAAALTLLLSRRPRRR